MPITKEQYENRLKWAEALESGNYKQTIAALMNNNGHCCLGVACDLFSKVEGEGDWKQCEYDPDRSFFLLDLYGHHACLPNRVKDWLGFDYSDPVLTLRLAEGIEHVHCATFFNDVRRLTFKEIAQAVRESAERDYKPEEL